MFRKILSLILCLSLFSTQSGFCQGIAELNLGQYLGQMRNGLAVDKFRPLHLRYLSYDLNTDNFQLLLDKGDNPDFKDNELEDKTKVLMEYFQIGLALPNDKFWVNLRPDAEGQIIDPELEKTDLGKVMLESDLQLKKDTANFTSPQTKEGREYWDKLYQKARELFGSEPANIPTITRPWIVPGEIIVREGETSAYIFKANLKVMLEEDYLSSQPSAISSQQYNFKDPRMKELNTYSTQLIRELIIPKLTKEVNTAKRYANLRQVFFSLVLARWFKERFKGLSPQGTVPFLKLIDSGNLTSLTSKEPWSKSYYFNEYKKSFEKGEYNLKENLNTPYGQVIRSYVSGGEELMRGIALNGIHREEGFFFLPEILRKISNFFGFRWGRKEDKLTLLPEAKIDLIAKLNYIEGLMNNLENIFSDLALEARQPGNHYDLLEYHSLYLNIKLKRNMLEETVEYRILDIKDKSDIPRLIISKIRDAEHFFEQLSYRLPDKEKIGEERYSSITDLIKQIKKEIPTLTQLLLGLAFPSEQSSTLKENGAGDGGSSPLSLEEKAQEIFYSFENLFNMKGELLEKTLSDRNLKFDEEEKKRAFPSFGKIKEIIVSAKRDLEILFKDKESLTQEASLSNFIEFAKKIILELKLIRVYAKGEQDDIVHEKAKGEVYILHREETPRRVYNINLEQKFSKYYSLELWGAGYLSSIDAFIAGLSRIIPQSTTEVKSEVQESEEGASSALKNQVGGIDFRSMQMLIQPMGSFSNLNLSLPTLSSSALGRIDLDKELAALRNMVKSGLVPSGARVKEYLAAVFQKGKMEEKQDDLLVCLAEIYRLQEEEVLETSPELRESLVMVETGRFVLLPNNQRAGLN